MVCVLMKQIVAMIDRCLKMWRTFKADIWVYLKTILVVKLETLKKIDGGCMR